MKDFWNRTAVRFGKKEDYAPVLMPRANGLLNWYIDFLQRTALRDVIRQFSGDAVLEVGCGVGRWSARMSAEGSRVVGVDLSYQMVKKAKSRMETKGLAADFVVANVEKLPFVSIPCFKNCAPGLSTNGWANINFALGKFLLTRRTITSKITPLSCSSDI